MDGEAPVAPAVSGGRSVPAAASRSDLPAVDAAMAELADLDGLPVERHADVYQGVHHRLEGAMVDADEG